MKKIFFLTTALVVGLFFARSSYATAELIWDNSPSWVASKNMVSFSMRAGDLNNDGFPDIVQADLYGQIYIYYNNAGQLPLTPSWTSSEILTPGCGFFDVQLGDINNDGFLDIIATQDCSVKVYVFFNHNGQFNLQADWASNKVCKYAAQIAKPADIDSDGDMDILVQCGADRLSLLRNDNGTLTKNPTWFSSERYVWWVQFSIADYDGDGVMEVAIPNGYEGSGAFPNFGDYRTFVYKYNSLTGGFDTIWKSPVGGGPAGAVAVTHAYWADYDNDGDIDLITSDGKVFLNTNGALSSTPIVFYPDYNDSTGEYGMAIGDYNKDGLIDVILTTHCQACPSVIYYFENSSNGLSLKQTVVAAPIIFLAGNIDYDIDGDEDLLLTYNGSAKIYSNRFVENSNKPPLADAGADQTVSCSGSNGAAVTLNGSGSSDPDGDALTYTWTGVFGTVTGVNPVVQIPLGTYTVTLKVDDGKGGTAEDTVNITVQDIVPPSTSATITGTSGNNGWYKSDVNVSLTSADNCSGVKEIHYILDGAETIISGSTAGFTISAEGEHSLSFWAVDNANNTETAHPATINIDKTAPVLNITVTPGLLWPPNHKMVNITPLINVSDNLTSNVQVELISVTSSEPDNGLGDGDTANDIVVNADGTISVRAERSGTGSGRVYTITYKATDLAGNVTLSSATAIVPHDMGK